MHQASEIWGGQKTNVLYGALLSWSGGTGNQKYLAESWKVPGVPNAVTGIAFHPYAMEGTYEQNIATFKNAVTGARNFINTLTNGAGKSLWLTEVGWAAEGVQFPMGQPTQASLLNAAFDYAEKKEAAYNLKAIVWYNYRPTE